MIARGIRKAHVISDDSDETARMRRLILVFAVRTSLIVGFVVSHGPQRQKTYLQS